MLSFVFISFTVPTTFLLLKSSSLVAPNLFAYQDPFLWSEIHRNFHTMTGVLSVAVF